MTRWLVLAGTSEDCGAAIDFYRHKDAFIEFVKTHQLEDGEQIGGDRLTWRLRSVGVAKVYRNGGRIHFVMANQGFLADDGAEEFIWLFDWNGKGVEDILRTTKTTTYHFQHFNSTPGWYYWLHN